MNRAERIYRLHQLLKGKRPVPLAGLIAKLEISKASISLEKIQCDGNSGTLVKL